MGLKQLSAIILAGGKGTRLQSVVREVPKPMAPIAGRPFLDYLLKYLILNGVTKIILSVGYRREVIMAYFKGGFQGVPVIYSVENSPLGTGGAIKAALDIDKYDGEAVLVLNGDTFFAADLMHISEFHAKQNADITAALKEMRDFDRYGAVELRAGRITSMREKKHVERGYINGGVYCIRPDVFDGFTLPEQFSFEQFLTDNVNRLKICGLPSEGSFIDIGIPEDYAVAQTLIPEWIKL